MSKIKELKKEEIVAENKEYEIWKETSLITSKLLGLIGFQATPGQVIVFEAILNLAKEKGKTASVEDVDNIMEELVSSGEISFGK